jgi:hypothetical protein
MLATVLVAGCSRESGTAGIDGTGVRTPVAAHAYGRVADFGSVWVNGVRYDTSRATFMINGQPGSQADLAIGDIVLVEGTLDASAPAGPGVADRVVFDHVLEGPITAIDAADGSLVALGQTVRIGASSSFDPAVQGALAGLAVGDVINVSGFRSADGAIAATRIGRQGPAGGFKTTGAVTSAASEGKRFSINALVVDYSAAVLLGEVSGRAIARGDIVEVKGAALGAEGELIATSVELKEILSGNAGDRVDIEGYVTSFELGTPDFQVAGLPVTTTDMTVFDGSLTLDAAIEVEGSLNASGVAVASEVRTGVVPTVGPHTVEGRVFDPYSGVVAGARVNLWVNTGRGGYSYWWAHHSLSTDEAGRFSAPNLPDSQITIHAIMPTQATMPTFVQPCAVIVALRDSLAVDVEMASAETLNSLNPPRPQSAREPTLTGTIFEMTEAGKQPVVGAKLWAEHLLEVSFATTLSDLQGGYFLCDLPAKTDLWVTKDGYENTVIWQIDTSQSTVLDIELKRE